VLELLDLFWPSAAGIDYNGKSDIGRMR